MSYQYHFFNFLHSRILKTICSRLDLSLESMSNVLITVVLSNKQGSVSNVKTIVVRSPLHTGLLQNCKSQLIRGRSQQER